MQFLIWPELPPAWAWLAARFSGLQRDLARIESRARSNYRQQWGLAAALKRRLAHPVTLFRVPLYRVEGTAAQFYCTVIVLVPIVVERFSES